MIPVDEAYGDVIDYIVVARDANFGKSIVSRYKTKSAIAVHLNV